MSKVSLALVVFLLVVLVQPVFAEDMKAGSKDAIQAATAPAVVKAVEVGNKICPVSGEKIQKTAMGEPVKYEYNGKLYGLCCPMCIKDFKKNPEKYAKIADDEVAAAAQAK